MLCDDKPLLLERLDSLGEHPGEHRNPEVHIVEHQNRVLTLILAAHPSHILRDAPLPSNRGSEDQRIEGGKVKTFPDVLARGEDQGWAIRCLELIKIRSDPSLLLRRLTAAHQE